MKRKSSKNDRLVYGAITAINLSMAVMFVAVLFPEPVPISFEPIVSAVQKRAPEPKILNINLGIPNRVVVESVGIDLPVKTGSYDEVAKTWTLDTTSAFYADRSVPANDNNGSTLIYGHAQWGLFAKLPEITTGATAQLYTDSGKVFSYVFQSSIQVKPDDGSVLVASGAPILTLLTCSGPFDAYRTLVAFKLTGVSSL